MRRKSEKAGSFAFRRTIAVALVEGGEMLAYPIPATNQFWIKALAGSNMQIIDRLGMIQKFVKE